LGRREAGAGSDRSRLRGGAKGGGTGVLKVLVRKKWRIYPPKTGRGSSLVRRKKIVLSLLNRPFGKTC